MATDPPVLPHRHDVPPSLRRRLGWLLSFCVAFDLVLLALVTLRGSASWGEFANWAMLGLVVLTLPVFLWLIGPLQDNEAPRTIAAVQAAGTPGPRWGRIALGGVSVIGVSVVLWWALLDHAWRPAIARGLAVLVYFSIFIPLARWHRLGVAPYLRPRFWGFLLAGAVASAVWSIAAQDRPLPAIISGTFSFPLVHYFLVRWTVRKVERAVQPNDASSAARRRV